MVNDLASLDDVIAALAAPTRRRVVELLAHGPLRASEIADRVGLSRPAMSRHLAELRAARLVTVDFAEHDARARSYRLAEERLAVVQAWLDQVHAHWAEQLGAFKKHAEKARS